jgi:hypothetical protein
MCRIRVLLGLWGVTLATLAGCALSESNQVKPPKPPEEFRAPPESDPRYSRPTEYPKETMEQDAILKKAKEAGKGASPPGGMRPGMGATTGRGF